MPDEDDRWFDALAGEAQSAAGGDSTTEGTALRAAILARAVTDPGLVPATDPAREAQLIARARAAGLLPPATHAVPAPPRRRTLKWAALAAVLACVAIGVSLQLRTNGPSLVLRGDSAGPVRIRASDPIRLKQDLIRELGAVGVHATGYQSLGRQGIDADLPAPLPAAVRQVLERHAIPIPAGTLLQLEIEADSAP